MQKCPFCASNIPDGAIVCTGCQATYGYHPNAVSKGWYITLFVIFGFFAIEALSSGYPGFAIFLGALSVVLLIFYFPSYRKKWWRSR